MRFRKQCPSHVTHLALAGIATLLMLALATPAAAADDQKGWFAALDIALTQPNSLDHHYADQIDFSGPFPQTNRLVLEDDDDTTFKVDIGYDFGGSLGSLKVSFWEFDNDDSQSGFVAYYAAASIFGNGYYGTYYGGYPYGMYVYDGNVTATATTEASTIDIDYVRPMVVGDKSTVNWLVGLRMATFEEDLGFVGNDGGGDYIQTRHIESDAVGIRLGAGAEFGFSDNFSLEAGMAVSLLQADTEGVSSQTFAGGAFESRVGEDDNVRGTIWDFDVRLLWTTTHLDYYLGYSASIWDGLVVNPVPPNTFGVIPGPSGARTRDSIGFNSVHAGLIWKFGGG